MASSPRFPTELTPRSKIQKMLDAIDNESDKENHSKNPTTTSAPVRAHSRAYQLRELAFVDTNDTAPPCSSGSEDEQYVKAVQSRGPMAARMRSNHAVHEGEESTSDGNAYDRVKRQLMKGKEKSPNVGIKPTWTTPQGFESCAEEPPVQVHRRLSRSPPIDTDGTPHHSASSRQSSPDLFISTDKGLGPPDMVRGGDSEGSDSDLPNNAQLQSQLQALVARKREERLAKEKAVALELSAEDTEQSYKGRSRKIGRRPVLVESESDNDKEVGRKLTQQTRPARKAGKKALEEMNRETQRMSRNMQLTYEARTKTNFTTQDFFKRFNFRQSADGQPDAPPSENASSSPAPVVSDGEAVVPNSTPPSSPPNITEVQRKPDLFPLMSDVGNRLDLNTRRDESEEEDLPTLEQALALVKEKPTITLISSSHKSYVTSPSFMERLKKTSVRQFAKSAKPLSKPEDSDDDDDLEIVKPRKPCRLAVFDQLPNSKARDSYSLHALRALAHLNDSDRPQKRSKDSMTSSELQILLHRRAKEQARHERDEKIQALKDKGVFVQTAEEKERDQMQLETMLEKARKEADELRRKEKEAAKQEGKDGNGELHLPDSDDEEEEEEWQASDEDGDRDIELSGSEDEGVALEDIESEEEMAEEDTTSPDAEQAQNVLLDDEAAEDADGEDDQDSESEDDEAEIYIGQLPHVRARRKTIVVSDDEDVPDTIVRTTPLRRETTTSTVKASTSDAFGFARTKPAPLRLSQVFAGTMASSPTQECGDIAAKDSQLDSLASLRGLAPPELHCFDANFVIETQDSIVPSSQYEEAGNQIYDETQKTGMVNFETQSQMPLGETQVTEVPDPTQDVGFQTLLSQSQIPASLATVDTLLLPCTVEAESPVMKKKGRLRRRIEANIRHLDEEEVIDEQDCKSAQAVSNHGHFEISESAFDIMRNASKKPAVATTYDKSTSKAKEMVDDQAEESEDEYAGLGGASDEEGQGELDEEAKKMINDEGNEIVDEGQMAAYFADQERVEDEKRVEKLYRDIANGGLRRKRGAEMDLWDSDDEDETAARRRAQKQKDFAKMRKALLADERIGKIAENPKQHAFLKAIEDHADLDDTNFLDQSEEETSQIPDSQDAVLDGQRKALQSITANSGKRKFSEPAHSKPSGPPMRPPPHLRRTRPSGRPASLADIRNTLSEIIGVPSSAFDSENPPPSDQSSSDEDVSPRKSQTNGSASRVASPRKPRRTSPNPTHTAVIDRMALKRHPSSLTSLANPNSRLAFHAPSKPSDGTFRVPSLLRRATTNASESVGDGGAGAGTSGGHGKEAVKMGGSNKSSVNYYVREKERRAKLEVVERERVEGRARVGRMRRSGLGLGGLGGGEWGL